METNIIANIKYFPKSGTTNDVGGMISTTSKKNTWRLIRIDMDNVTCNKNIKLQSIIAKNYHYSTPKRLKLFITKKNAVFYLECSKN